ncbi:Com family DNA-binding transcriptional regulator [Ancylobacter dichloromethanicus]|uniref:Com family DNA-binding transcriptional regulator n=1 Tax=Ancylobacter dichloromethanicus TaxID=518825 RepID=UPI001BCFE099|nr:Com family DNA-binding transcriptional regulator [Ancylobacter dichloromethanicus]
MKDIRCSCGALLFRAAGGALRGAVEIKCRRCGTLNFLRPIEPESERRERHSNGDDACGLAPKR